MVRKREFRHNSKFDHLYSTNGIESSNHSSVMFATVSAVPTTSSIRTQTRNLYINYRKLTPNDLFYKIIQFECSYTITQIEYWIKYLTIDKNGKLAHLKYMNNDTNPLKKLLWARLHD